MEPYIFASVKKVRKKKMPKKRFGRGFKSNGGAEARGRKFSKANKGKFDKSKRKHGKPGQRRGAMPELMDLEAGDNMEDMDFGSKMAFLSRRPGRLEFQNEVGYTDRHRAKTMREPLRNRPIQFVKAKEVYDPSTDLFRNKKKEDMPQENKEMLKLLDDSVNMEEPKGEDLHEGRESSQDSDSEETSAESSTDSEADDEEEGEEEENEEDPIKENGRLRKKEDNETAEARSANNVNVQEEEASKKKSRAEQTAEEGVSFFVDELRDDDIAGVKDKTISSRAIISESSKMPSGDTKRNNRDLTEHDPVLNIGKVSLPTFRDENGDTYTNLRKMGKGQFLDTSDKSLMGIDISSSDYSDDSALRDYMDQVKVSDKNMSINASEEKINESNTANLENLEKEDSKTQTEKEPEFGFLPEDYEFDVSGFQVANVRFGIQNQLYVKCYELTGSEDYVWVDQDECVDYVMLKGVRDYRMPSFLDFITKGMINQNELQLPAISDVIFSDESDSDVYLDSDDNLEHLVSFSRNNRRPEAEFDEIIDEGLHPKIIGKGKKKQLHLDSLKLDADIAQSLKEKFKATSLENAAKKESHEAAKIEQAIKNGDLFVKYPYVLHIRDIKSEFDSFLNSPKETMSFPPLDPHGNKTIVKLSDFYNMKSSKCGSSVKLFMKISKCRKTFNNVPRYDQIGYVLKQRPIFPRTDQKKPREEKLREKNEKASKKGSGANVKEGEIVGGQAPEIGTGNIGRQLLEKLGWVQGQGLGAHGNKGISAPVAAKVKKTKTGIK